ncbi:hypothetical protein PInf_024592 [Phytophthora infestans]|nr:hypothetical protein PInf_024592 [Phytophthora infestans]
MALQVSLSTFARIALISVDSAFLGHLGTSSLAAASLASTWTNVPLAGVWSGATALITLCGQAWGAKNGELSGVWLQIGLVVVSVLSIPVFIWYWSIGYVLQLSTDDAEVVQLGSSARLSIGVACAANYVLIFGAFGWGGLGFDGSPWPPRGEARIGCYRCQRRDLRSLVAAVALFWGYGSATQIRVANYLGAGRPKAARVLGFLGFLCTVGTVVALAIPIFITGYMIESLEILTSSVLAAMGEVTVTAWVSSLSVWCVELPIAYVGGVTMGLGFSALWYGVCTMEVLKLAIFSFVLSRTNWTEMAERAVKNMEATSDSDTALAPVVRSPAAPGLMTPSGRRRQWDQIEDGTLLRSPFFGRTPRSGTSLSQA